MGKAVVLVAAALLCLLCACVEAQEVTTLAPSTALRVVPGNCAVNAACPGEPLQPGQVRLCCPAQNEFLRLFRYVFLPNYLFCRCQARPTGNCWQGSQCNACPAGNVGSLNGLAVCCPRCGSQGLQLSPTSCNCS